MKQLSGHSEAVLIKGSPDRFGYEWNIYSEPLPEHRGQLQRWLGDVTIDSFRGKTVLDVGCGMGRNSFWIVKSGAQSVLAIDVDSRSLEAAKRNLNPFPRVKVAELSVFSLASDSVGVFDRVICIGVLHHLADPALALKMMWKVVAPGGELILWCYGNQGNRLFLPAIRAMKWMGSRLPLPLTHRLAKAITCLAWPLLKAIPWRTEYYRNLKSLSFRNVESIIFDQMIPHIAHYWTEEEMMELVRPLDGQKKMALVQGNSWSVLIKKPT